MLMKFELWVCRHKQTCGLSPAFEQKIRHSGIEEDFEWLAKVTEFECEVRENPSVATGHI